MVSWMRQVWFATAMRGNKYQGRLTIDFTTKEPTQDCKDIPSYQQVFFKGSTETRYQ